MDDPMKTMKVPDGMVSELKEAATMIDSTEGVVRVISHHDGDGICSAGILGKALNRAGKMFQASMTDVLKPEDIENLNGGFDLYIISDMGSQLAPSLSDRVLELGKRCIILDHHKPGDRNKQFSISDGRGILEINPRFHGINGTSGCCGSTLSFLESVVMNPVNTDMCIFSLAGAIADRQHVPEFTELNLGVKELALDMDFVRSNIGMPLHGNTLEEAILMSNDPFIKGLSGERSNVRSALSMLGIEPEISPGDLRGEKLKMVQSFLYSRLLDNGVDYHRVHELFRENLISEKYGDLQSLAYEIDSCGRLDEMGVGFDAVWGGEEALKRAYENRNRNRKKVQSNVLDLIKKGVNEEEYINWFEIEDNSLAGTVAGIAHNYVFDHRKPIMALSEGEDGTIKVSSRGNHELVRRGLDLGKIMDEVCGGLEGSGGGHDVAAGGSFTSDKKDDFISGVDKMVGEQIHKGDFE